MDHIHALPVGFQLDNYRIEGILGHGGFGITYKAVDIYLNKVFAIKEFLPNEFAVRAGDTVAPKSQQDADDFQWGLDRFLQEAQVLARFTHPNVNHVHRFFQAHGTAYMVLNYEEGITLSKKLQTTPVLGNEEVQRLLIDLTSGLRQVHQAGMIHRDIKPGNIIIRPDGSAVLLDFGAARQAIGNRSGRVTQILTPGYAPIEQYAESMDQLGPWTDIYALGMVAYRAITGVGDDKLMDAVSRSLTVSRGGADMPTAESIGAGKFAPGVLQGVDWAMQVNENQRPQSVEVWQQKLGIVAESTPPATPAPSGHAEPAATVMMGQSSNQPVSQGSAPQPAQQSSAAPVTSAPPQEGNSGGVMKTLLILLVGVGVGVGGYFVAQSQLKPDIGGGKKAEIVQKKDPVAPKKAESGPLKLTLSPSTAKVVMTGSGRLFSQGMSLPHGRYEIRVSADGFQTSTLTITHDGSQTPMVSLSEVVPTEFPFTVARTPSNARVRILNIGPAYTDGMMLAPGRYRVEVSKAGYRTYTGWYEFKPKSGDKGPKIDLKRSGYIVDASGKGDYTSLKSAVAAAKTGDTLLIKPGRYQGPIILNKAIKLKGDGDRSRIIITSTTENTFAISADATVENLTLKYTGTKENQNTLWITGGSPVIHNNDLSNGQSTILAANGTSKPTVTDNYFHSTPWNAINVYGDVRGTYRSNHFHGLDKPVFVSRERSAPKVQSNRFTNNSSNHFLIKGSAKGSYENNVIRRAGESFVVSISGTATPTMLGLDVKSPAGRVFLIQEQAQPVIKNSKLTGLVNWALWVEGSASPRFEGNEVDGFGLTIYDTSSPLVINNTLRNIGGNGINIREEASGTYRGNKFYNVGYDEDDSYPTIYIHEDAAPIVTGNRFFQGGSQNVHEAGSKANVQDNY
ncbi:right-handed parallel beta-helix repeat-containing protein [Corallincola platygyrae]|uniref:Right-handed parallel beta-helix repeat-containing protein n=1 Tax=Corallincola platygyrae TaxID=1193278 RepID=A0ABW4XPB0_9GAMM